MSTDQKEVKTWTLRARSTRICTNFSRTEVSAEGPEIKGVLEVVPKSDFDTVMKERDSLIKTVALLLTRRVSLKDTGLEDRKACTCGRCLRDKKEKKDW